MSQVDPNRIFARIRSVLHLEVLSEHEMTIGLLQPVGVTLSRMSPAGGRADEISTKTDIGIWMSGLGVKAEVLAHPSECPGVARVGHLGTEERF